VTVVLCSFIVSENGVSSVCTVIDEEHRRSQEYAGSIIPRKRHCRSSDAMRQAEIVSFCRADRVPRAAGNSIIVIDNHGECRRWSSNLNVRM